MERRFRVFIPFIGQALFDEWLILIGRLIRETLTSGINAEADNLRALGDEILVEAMGVRMLGVDAKPSKAELAAQRQWLYGKSLTIAGGTMEVQKNIIAKRVLGLPD